MQLFTRSQFLKVMTAVPLVGAVLQASARAKDRRRYTVPPSLWYENEAGEKFLPKTAAELFNVLPSGFPYQHSQFPRELHHSCCTSKGLLFNGTASWPEDLVFEMAATTRDYRLSEAILITANLCERCLNAAAFDYGLKWGYRRHSDQWNRANTQCEACKQEGKAL